MLTFGNLRWIIFIFSVVFLPHLSDTVLGQANQHSLDLITLQSPLQGEETISKKPIVTCHIAPASPLENLVVLLDGIDITAVLDITTDGFTYKPISVLAPGEHIVTIYGNTSGGAQIEKEFTFTTRHFEHVAEAAIHNEISGFYENVMRKSDDVVNEPNWKAEANIATDANLKEKGWDFSFQSNLRSLGQNLSIEEPLKKGTDLVDYLLTGVYNQGRFGLTTQIGDTLVDMTPYTAASLARRGGQASIQYGDAFVSGFLLKGKEVYGFQDGLGLSTNTDDHIVGVSGGMAFFNNQMGLKTIYVEGGEKGSHFGTYTEEGARKGEVIGVVLTTDFFKEALTSEFEIDFSDYDDNVEDELDAESDRAYRIGFGGQFDKYTYEAVYEYLGPEYQVIANQGLELDKKGFSLAASAEYAIHSLAAKFSRYHDNVENDDFYPRIVTTQEGVEYSFTKFEHLPITINFEKWMVDSSDVPEDTEPTESETETVGISINYIMGNWQLGLNGTYSDQDDQTPSDDDSTIHTVALTPVFSSDSFYLGTSANYQQHESQLTDVVTDYYTFTVDIQGGLLNQRISYELGASYDKNQSDDDEIDLVTIQGTGRLAYSFGNLFWGYLNPSVGLKGLYEKNDDNVSDEKTKAYAISLVFETSIPFSF